MTENKYLSYSIYYAEPWEKLLVSAIHPLVKKLFDDGWISQYFFIRYWERGPHIRLRLKKKSGVNEVELSETVQENLQKFITENPSKLFFTPEMEEKSKAESWHKNNQIFSVEYQPETARYGGVDALPLAELQFFASSRVVLNELLEISDWSYDHALGAAIKLHLGFVFSMGMSAEKAVAFFKKNCQDWMPRAYQTEVVEIQKEKILLQFQNAYQAQKMAVLPYIQGVWEELQQNPSGSGVPAWENWLTINQAVFTNLQILQKNGLLNLVNAESNSDGPTESELWTMLSDFVHLNNNRLGVLNRDEGFLAFMLAEALSTF